jgi:hypothetical protein
VLRASPTGIYPPAWPLRLRRAGRGPLHRIHARRMTRQPFRRALVSCSNKRLLPVVYSCIINRSTSYGFNIPVDGTFKVRVSKVCASAGAGDSAFNIPVFASSIRIDWNAWRRELKADQLWLLQSVRILRAPWTIILSCRIARATFAFARLARYSGGNVLCWGTTTSATK